MQPQTPPPEAVPKRVQSKLAVFTPSPELVDAYLSEIARGYGVSYAPLCDSGAPGSDGEEGSNDEGGDEAEGISKEESPATSEKEPPRKTSSPPSVPSVRQPTVVKKRTEVDELAARFERLKNIR